MELDNLTVDASHRIEIEPSGKVNAALGKALSLRCPYGKKVMRHKKIENRVLVSTLYFKELILALYRTTAKSSSSTIF
jgi:hypothetical protein